ncbi:ribosome recycling factor [Lacticaseibacillus manihotivorans]|uniref:Ribosome-recycling factor n=2 Tax=Lacticaseibacillus manihotivorans TaxID=88233 RepID=A0A0R1QU63_9LACO|nr:ribosome recycling factor [Lacticaseibacillus manihotivorans]KRL45797.1 ribosome recycling factor [Lacticaseibacillus manihotivorans DSM 13343 = JCM 12514]QFQ91304.1 ribosome recycling factor [Lacticaseibacillus manihotivorans]
MANEIIEAAKANMQKSAEALQRELGGIRAGRANAGLLNRVEVEYYGVMTPLNQMAAITIPEPRVLMVTPYDKSILKDIEAAINMSDLGINPANDGSTIRLVIPQLTGERRQELAKEVGKYEEEAKIATRNVRRDALDKLKKQEKAGEITEDDLHRFEKDIQKVIDDAAKNIEQIARDKEKEITEG